MFSSFVKSIVTNFFMVPDVVIMSVTFVRFMTNRSPENVINFCWLTVFPLLQCREHQTPLKRNPGHQAPRQDPRNKIEFSKRSLLDCLSFLEGELLVIFIFSERYEQVVYK